MHRRTSHETETLLQIKKRKRGFHRAVNSVFGKIGRVASEEVFIQLISSKCMPILLYGLVACALTKADIRSLDFVLNRFL